MYKPLTIGRRVYHFTLGVLETAGYLTLIIPFITAVADRLFNKPWFPKGFFIFRTHMEELGSFYPRNTMIYWRKNPFDQDAIEDPFYQGASWLPRT